MRFGNTVCGGGSFGAEKVLAIDIDPEAVKVSAENVKLNRCTDTVEVRQGNLIDGVDFKAGYNCGKPHGRSRDASHRTYA